jgi:hypothetical protein
MNGVISDIGLIGLYESVDFTDATTPDDLYKGYGMIPLRTSPQDSESSENESHEEYDRLLDLPPPLF